MLEHISEIFPSQKRSYLAYSSTRSCAPLSRDHERHRIQQCQVHSKVFLRRAVACGKLLLLLRATYRLVLIQLPDG